MKIREIFYDAAKYPFLGLKQLLLLGLMILIISLIIGNQIDLDIYLETLSDVQLLLILLLFTLIVALFSIIEAGYAFKVIENTILGVKKPPKLNNLISMLKHGLNEIIIGVIYFSVPIIIVLIILDFSFSQINFGFPTISDEMAVLLIFLVIIVGFITDILFKVAIPHMAFKGGAFREAFRIFEIFRKIKQIGLKKLLIGYFIVILGVVVIGGPILKEIIGSTNIFGFFIAEELIAPYFIMFAARFNALIYLESF